MRAVASIECYLRTCPGVSSGVPWSVLSLTLLIAMILFSTGCDRLVLPPLPDGIPEGASYDRRNRLWIVRSNNRELAFYANGKPAYTVELKDGRREGAYTSYAPDGITITTSGEYRNGRRNGIWVHRDDSGRLYVKIGYSAEPSDPVLTAVSGETGNENGPFERYYPDGKIELTGKYRAGRFDGLFRRYGRSGRIEYEGRYSKGQKEGLWRIYDRSGALLREEHYHGGELEGSFRIFRSNHIVFETVYNEGREVGPRRNGRW